MYVKNTKSWQIYERCSIAIENPCFRIAISRYMHDNKSLVVNYVSHHLKLITDTCHERFIFKQILCLRTVGKSLLHPCFPQLIVTIVDVAFL